MTGRGEGSARSLSRSSGAGRNQEALERRKQSGEKEASPRWVWEGQVYMKPEEERLGSTQQQPLVTQVGGRTQRAEKSLAARLEERRDQQQASVSLPRGLRADGASGEGDLGWPCVLLFKDLSPQHERDALGAEERMAKS